ncbi:carbon-phosphorus lyase complex subunit PhnI, partial [Rhizobium johnstonii]
RVMAEASLFDRTLAALAIRQSRGDMIEAIFLLLAYRTTLPRFGRLSLASRAPAFSRAVMASSPRDTSGSATTSIAATRGT